MKGIYTIRHIETGRCYVGSSGDVARRWKEHEGRLRRGTHPAKYLLNAFRKYGASAFVYEILEECDLMDDATRIARETHWIKLLSPVFNTAPVAGSLLGMKRSAETRAKMSKAQRGRVSPLRGRPRPPEVRAAIAAGTKGRVHSAEHRKKISEAMRGKKSPRTGVTLSEETKARIAAGRSGIASSPESRMKAALSNLGQKRTDEQKARMSAAQKGRTFSDETKRKMADAALAFQARKRELQIH